MPHLSRPLKQVLTILFMQSVFQNFAVLAQLLSVCPLTSVSRESSFSAQNIPKTKQRSQLSESHQESLMRIKLEGPSLQDFDAKQTARSFLTNKPRRK